MVVRSPQGLLRYLFMSGGAKQVGPGAPTLLSPRGSSPSELRVDHEGALGWCPQPYTSLSPYPIGCRGL